MNKWNDRIGFVLFLIIFFIMFPFNFVLGGLQRNRRYYWYVHDTVNNKKPRRYYF